MLSTPIITHRPAVNAGWYEDFRKVFGHDNPEYQFGTRDNVEVGTKWSELRTSKRPFIYFASIQDLRGSVEAGGKYSKNDDVFDFSWDLVIVDEAHEGTQTILGDNVIQRLLQSGEPGHRTLLLALSGTPFNIAEKYEDMCFTWDYVQEQKRKREYAELGLSNPYEDLPEMRMMTFNLADEFEAYQQFQDKAFNFSEFFRVGEAGFVHQDDVKRFLELLCRPGKAGYPFTSDEYRKMFRHTLWIIPGVKEARELQKLLEVHDVFGQFAVCNVAGEGNIENDDALQTVKNGIKANDYTITLSCGKLTTGVTVPEWTAVLYLAGTTSTSAQSYMQTIFRVQSPCNSLGMSKQYCYVFDFAPDRSLKLVSDAIALGARKPGKTTKVDKTVIGEFLNFCPIISVDAAQMSEYNVDSMMRQLKNAFAERAVRNGFEDNSLYNANLLHLDELDKELFKKLGNIVGSSKAGSRDKSIIIADTGFTDEEYNVTKQPNEGAESEHPDQRAKTEEERTLEEAKKERLKAINILRSVSVRIPLLIYGAVVGNGNGDDDFCNDKEVTLEWLLNNVDETSWNEFMPAGVTKELFKAFTKYYDEDIFIAAGKQIRQKVKDADALPPLLRVQKIIELLSCFKNPDKETVLTPWRVVNMHMSDCLGGYDWFDENHDDLIQDKYGDPAPRWVDQGQVTKETWDNPQARILEINSKTGVYPLYATFSIWARKCYDEYISRLNTSNPEAWKRDIPLNDLLKLIDEGRQKSMWQEVVSDNIYVVSKTPMAQSITRRTLLGFEDGQGCNIKYIENLVNIMKEDCGTVAKGIRSKSFWNQGTGTMKFDAVIGNPPYMLKTCGASKNQAVPIFPYFCYTAVELQPRYVSIIMPSKWFAGGMPVLDSFRNQMMIDSSIRLFKDFTNSKDCFPSASIAGGVCYYLRDSMYAGTCRFTNITSGKLTTVERRLNEFPVVVRRNIDCGIIHKIQKDSFVSLQGIVSPLDAFGLPSKCRGIASRSDDSMLKLYTSEGVSYIARDSIPVSGDGAPKGQEFIDCYKVMVSITSAEHAGEPDKNGQVGIITKSVRVLSPGEICNFSYFLVGKFQQESEANNALKYLKTRFTRCLMNPCVSSIHLSRKVFPFVPLQDFTSESDIDWNTDVPAVEQQLYKKYGFSEDEIQYIESTIKPMQ